jgi:hypothetical protein
MNPRPAVTELLTEPTRPGIDMGVEVHQPQRSGPLAEGARQWQGDGVIAA